jgi:hypothetical protein
MVSHKFFLYYVLILSVLHSCKPKEQPKVLLNQSSKDYFSIQNNSIYNYTTLIDTNIQLEFKTANFFTTFSNPDITNNEVISYDLLCNDFPIQFTFKIESGPTQFKDRITVISKRNDSFFLGPFLFNLNGNFELPNGSKDSIYQVPSTKFNNTAFNDVIRIKLFNHPLFNEIYFAKFKGMVAFIDKNGKLHYAIKNNIIN